MPILRTQGALLNRVQRKADSIFSTKVVSGNADFFSVSSLDLTLLASSTDPFAFDIQGSFYEITSDVTLAVTDTAHNFIWIDASGALGRSALPCLYHFTAPSSPATDQHWYDLGKSRMKRWDGAAWENVDRIFVGYVRADGGSINARYACEPMLLSPLERFNFFGSGEEGFLDVSSGTTTKNGFFRQTAVVVRGGTLNHSASQTTITTFQCQGLFIVLSPGTVNLDGLGLTGASGGTGAGGAAGTGGQGGRGGGGGGGTSGAGGAGASGPLNSRSTSTGGGGGAGGTSGGGAGGNGTNALSALGPGLMSFFLFPHGGAGGGGGGDGSAGGNGGAPGGSFQIKTASFAVSSGATLSANGTGGTNGPAAGRGGGGAGGGGCIAVWSRNYFQSGSLSVAGGPGGNSGGAGSGAGGNGGSGRVSLVVT